MLSEPDKAQFDRDGYLMVPALVSDGVRESLLKEIDLWVAES